MIIKNLEVNDITLTKLDSRSQVMELKVNFTNDTPLKLSMTLEDDFEILVGKLLKKIKATKLPQDTDEDEILGGITVITIKNEDDIKERTPKRLFLLSQRLVSLNKTKDAKNYMRLFSQINTMEDIIYVRG